MLSMEKELFNIVLGEFNSLLLDTNLFSLVFLVDAFYQHLNFNLDFD